MSVSGPGWGRRKQFRKLFRTPTDEKRDHRNFTEHLAGSSQLEFNTFEMDKGIGKYDSAIEAGWKEGRITIRRPKGRLPFDSNLLTAGQIKFGNHLISSKIRKKLMDRQEKMIGELSQPSSNSSSTTFTQARAKSYDLNRSESQRIADRELYSRQTTATSNISAGSLEVYDAVYNMLENRRTAVKASEHFHRPKIFKNHVKEVKNAQNYGYKTSIGQELDDLGRNNHVKADPKRGRINSLQYNLDWAELRSWIYGFKKKSEIRNVIIEQIVNEHGEMLKKASLSSNPVLPITAALQVALAFQAQTVIQTGGHGVKGPIVCGLPGGVIEIGTGSSEEEDDGSGSGGFIIQTGKSLDGNYTTNTVSRLPKLDKEQLETVQEIAQDIADEGTQEIKNEINDKLEESGLPTVKSENPEQIMEELLKSLQDLDNTQRFAVNCNGKIQEVEKYLPMTSSVDLSSIVLDMSQDRNNTTIGRTGYRPIRNAWRLFVLGDPNVFKRNPITSADIIVLIDVSGSMGILDTTKTTNGSRYYADGPDPLQQAADIAMAVKKRFPDSKVYGFTNYDRRNGDNSMRFNAGLYEVKEHQFPAVSGGSTPMCGALKTLEEEFTLDSARVIIIGDGDANSCSEGDGHLCSRNIVEGWRNKGIRFATVYTPHSRYSSMPTSFPGDMNVQLKPGKSPATPDIERIFAFLRS